MKPILFVVFCGLAAYVYAASFSLPPAFFQPLGGAGYARIVAVILVVATVGWVLFTGILPWLRRRHMVVVMEETTVATTDASRLHVMPWFAAFMLIYAVSVFTVGYFVSTFTFLFVTMLLIVENRRPIWVRLLGLATAITVVLFGLFRLVRFYLPAAWLF